MFIGDEGHVYLNFYERSFANKVVLIHIVFVWAEVAGNSIFFFISIYDKQKWISIFVDNMMGSEFGVVGKHRFTL